MTLTTIKVEMAVRDRLAGIARARGMTMGALLESESRRLEAEQRWTEIESSYQHLRHDDPDGWREYVGEIGEWSAATADPDPAAAEEWPELNR